MYKYFYWSLLVYCIYWFSVFAAQWDCSWFTATNQQQRDQIISTIPFSDDIYNRDNLKLSIRNLQQYCDSLLKRQSDTTKIEVAQSPWLYDHLIDIGWRSLDGDTSYSLQPHPLWIARRDSVRDIISRPEWILPKILADMYRSQWTSMTTMLSSCGDISNNSDSWLLWERYYHMCVVSSCIEKSLLGDSYYKIFPRQWDIDVCQQRAMERIDQEWEFTRYRMKQVSTNMAKTIWQKYLNEDLLQRSSSVLDMMHYYEQDFTNVTRKIQWTKQCT